VKQKLNTKSSTEAETIGASDYLPHTVWTMNFMAAQGYKNMESVFYQDNESAIRLERNGRASAGQKSRHINIRYFFIKDRVKIEGISIVHCPTGLMLADFFTKPLQGALFRKFRDVLLGYKHISVLEVPPATRSEERVGRSVLRTSVDGRTLSGTDGQTLKKITFKEDLVIGGDRSREVRTQEAAVEGAAVENKERQYKSYADALRGRKCGKDGKRNLKSHSVEIIPS